MPHTDLHHPCPVQYPSADADDNRNGGADIFLYFVISSGRAQVAQQRTKAIMTCQVLQSTLEYCSTLLFSLVRLLAAFPALGVAGIDRNNHLRPGKYPSPCPCSLFDQRSKKGRQLLVAPRWVLPFHGIYGRTTSVFGHGGGGGMDLWHEEQRIPPDLPPLTGEGHCIDTAAVSNVVSPMTWVRWNLR